MGVAAPSPPPFHAAAAAWCAPNIGVAERLRSRLGPPPQPPLSSAAIETGMSIAACAVSNMDASSSSSASIAQFAAPHDGAAVVEIASRLPRSALRLESGFAVVEGIEAHDVVVARERAATRSFTSPTRGADPSAGAFGLREERALRLIVQYARKTRGVDCGSQGNKKRKEII